MLFTYGLPEDGKDFVHDDGDADLELVPNLVEKVALPILHYEISHCWDMLSQQETVNAVAATKLIVQHVSHESEALADLLVSIRTRLADAVANLTVCSVSKYIYLLNTVYPIVGMVDCGSEFFVNVNRNDQFVNTVP